MGGVPLFHFDVIDAFKSVVIISELSVNVVFVLLNVFYLWSP